MRSTRVPPSPDCADGLAEALRGHDLHAVLPLAWDAYGARLLQYVQTQGFTAVEADDVVQEVFRCVCEQWQVFDGASFDGWLFTLARYATLTARKAKARARSRAAEPCDVPTSAPPDEALVSTVRLDAVIAGLGPVDRLIVRCLAESARTGEIQAAIVEAFGRTMNEPQVRKRVQRLRALLAERVGWR